MFTIYARFCSAVNIATRRWMIGSGWRYDLHGYYTKHGIDTWSMAGIPNFQFRFTIYEGDWGKPYAARFEVWFTPDTGAKDRKLMEKVFKIEGWQR